MYASYFFSICLRQSAEGVCKARHIHVPVTINPLTTLPIDCDQREAATNTGRSSPYLFFPDTIFQRGGQA